MVIAQLLGVEKVLSVMEQAGSNVHQVLRSEVRSLAIMLSGYVKTDKLSGEVLHVRTGRLRRSITFRVDEQGSLISGVVGTNVEYAAAHEFGMDEHKSVTVREYQRTQHSKAISDWRRKHKMAVGMVTVHSFTRNQHIHLPERSFLRSALAELGPDIRADLESAIRRAIS